MKVEKLELSNSQDAVKTEYVCRIELTLEEAEAIMSSLMRTYCGGNDLIVATELEDKLFDNVIKHFR